MKLTSRDIATLHALKPLSILTAIGFSARRHEGEQPECMLIHEDCEPSEQRRPKIQVRRVYIRLLSKLRNLVRFAANNWREPEFTAGK